MINNLTPLNKLDKRVKLLVTYVLLPFACLVIGTMLGMLSNYRNIDITFYDEGVVYAPNIDYIQIDRTRYSVEDLVHAIAIHESGDNPDVISVDKNGNRYYGLYQFSKPFIDHQEMTTEDACNRDISTKVMISYTKALLSKYSLYDTLAAIAYGESGALKQTTDARWFYREVLDILTSSDGGT